MRPSCKVDTRRRFRSRSDRDLDSSPPPLFASTTTLRSFLAHRRDRRRPRARRRLSRDSHLSDNHSHRHRLWRIQACRRRHLQVRRHRCRRMFRLRASPTARKTPARIRPRVLRLVRIRTVNPIPRACAKRLRRTSTNGLECKICPSPTRRTWRSCSDSWSRVCSQRTPKNASCASWLNSPSLTVSAAKCRARRLKRARSFLSLRSTRTFALSRDWFVVRKNRWRRGWHFSAAPWSPLSARRCATRMNVTLRLTRDLTSARSLVCSTRCTPQITPWTPRILKFSRRLPPLFWRCNRFACRALHLPGLNSSPIAASCLVS
mmetsp:Transcript_5202/g.20233  ORF Transcript_5202/g.20233 Transcript_5202/m.20233 type:complete len:319 (+) Transcript_5202:1919-2875(+)